MEKVENPVKHVGGDGDLDSVMTIEEPEEQKTN